MDMREKVPIWLRNLAAGYWDGIKECPTGAWLLTFAAALLLTAWLF